MFPFLRLSAVMASIVVASTAFGFGLGSAVSASASASHVRSLNGISVFSSSDKASIVAKYRSSGDFRDLSFADVRLDNGNVPAVNMAGPRPGSEHVDLGAACPIASSCLVAMN